MGYIPDLATYSTPSDPNRLMLQNVGTPQPTSVLNLLLAFANKDEEGPNPSGTNVNFVGTKWRGLRGSVLRIPD